MTTRILLADNQRIVREGVRRLLETHGFEVVAETDDGEEAIRLVSELRPDIAIIEICTPSGFEAVRAIAASKGRTRCCVLSAQQSSGPVEEALRSGAAGYVPKSAPSKELIDAIEAISAGRSFLSSAITMYVVEAVSRPGDAPRSALAVLTRRERDVLRLIAGGLRSKEVAGRLGLTPKTVETHRANLMAKLDIHNVVSLVHLAIREGMVTP